MNMNNQNVYLWVLPDKHNPHIELKPHSFVTYEVHQPQDGVFYYDIWLRYHCDEKACISVHPNGAPLFTYETLEVKPDYTWIYCGTPMFAKGLQSLKIFNRGDVPFTIDSVVLTYDKDYIGSGEADRDALCLRQGTAPPLKNADMLMGREQDSRKNNENLKKLSRSGFLERPDQAVYTTNCRNGVPMGGIGAGKIELDADGVFTAITINQNFDVPIYKTAGSFFAVRWEGGAKLLQKVNYNPFAFPTVKEIEYEGLFPGATLCYRDEDIPVELRLNAFSPLIPGDINSSCMPCVIYEFEAENKRQTDMEISIMFSWENMIGTGGSMLHKSLNSDVETINILNTWNPGYTWSNRTGTYQKTASDNEIGFFSLSDNKNPESFGQYTILTDDQDEVSQLESWRVFSEGQLLWDDFVSDGKLNPSYGSQLGKEGEDYLAAALCKRLRLKPGEKKTCTFVLAWYMPHMIDEKGNDQGVYYTNLFSSASGVAHVAMNSRTELRSKTVRLSELMLKSSLPEWLSKKLINDMFPILTCSVFTKSGHFSINEAPTGMMGCLGTMDQRLACNVIYTNFFRELDKRELLDFAKNQGKDGSISHDLGSGSFELPEYGGSWSDLASSFTIQVYKHYLYTGDETFFNEMYPRVKRAVAWQQTIDYDKNGIPDVGAGNGTTYDTYHWYGTSSFVASLWLAQLKACIHMAKMRGDSAFLEECELMFKRAQQSMINELWTDKYPCGGYFLSYYDATGSHKTENCFLAQLAGQWAAHLMDLSYILPEDMIKEAVKTITRQNIYIDGLPGMNDETTPEGEHDWFGYSFVQYDEVYYGCLAIYNGFFDEGIGCFKKVYEMNKHAPWNVPLTQHADGHIIGLPYYMTNPASFFLLEALSGYLPDVVNRRMKLSPNIGSQNNLKIPLFSPAIWIWLNYEQCLYNRTFNIKVLETIEREYVEFTQFTTEIPSGMEVKSLVCGGRVCDYHVSGRQIHAHVDWRLCKGAELTIEIEFL